MDRRTFLAATGAAALAPALPVLAQTKPPVRTQWRVRGSEGMDAIVFLGPLSGGELYRRTYAAEADAFASRLPPSIRDDIAALWREAGSSSFGLLGPSLVNLLSGADLTTLDRVIAALDDPDGVILPRYRASAYWSATDWAWLAARRSRLRAVFSAMRDAGFPAFRTAHLAPDFEARVAEQRRALSDYDVIRWHEKLTGRAYDPVINVVLLQFVRPHGIRVQDQTFLQAVDYSTAVTVQIAAHEMLHPPFDLDRPVGKALLATLGRDPLIQRILREHDPKWGYTTLKGLVNEDICQALDQMISEALGVGLNPADRWNDHDDGVHVMAAAFYGMLRQDRWQQTGGSIEQWFARATTSGRLRPEVLHPIAARVLDRPVGALWPQVKAGPSGVAA